MMYLLASSRIDSKNSSGAAVPATNKGSIQAIFSDLNGSLYMEHIIYLSLGRNKGNNGREDRVD